MQWVGRSGGGGALLEYRWDVLCSQIVTQRGPNRECDPKWTHSRLLPCTMSPNPLRPSNRVVQTLYPLPIYHVPCTIYHIACTIYHIPYTLYHITYTIYQHSERYTPHCAHILTLRALLTKNRQTLFTFPLVIPKCFGILVAYAHIESPSKGTTPLFLTKDINL